MTLAILMAAALGGPDPTAPPRTLAALLESHDRSLMLSLSVFARDHPDLQAYANRRNLGL